MIKRAGIALLLLLALVGQAAGQMRSAVADGRLGKTDEITLEVGQWHIFNFDLTKPFVIEAESLFSPLSPPVYEDKTGKALVVFGAASSDDQPVSDKVVVRVLQDNRTVYRALVTINGKPQPAPPSPYIGRLQAAYAKDAGTTAADIKTLDNIFGQAVSLTATAATGKDIWDKITQSYLPMGNTLKEVRREIGVILGETTTAWYNQTLDSQTRKDYAKVLKQIQQAVQQLQSQPAPVPVSKGPYYIVVVKEASKQTPEEAAFYNDDKVQEYLKGKGHRWLVVDEDVSGKNAGVPELLKPYLALAKGKTLPWAIIVDLKTGRKLSDQALPLTVDGFTKMLEALGG